MCKMFKMTILTAIVGISIMAIPALADSANTPKELPVPISFIDNNYSGELIDTIPFDLSNDVVSEVYLIEKGSKDLIIVFEDVSNAVNFSLINENGEKHSAGFNGRNNVIYLDIDPNFTYQFECTLGYTEISSSHKSTQLVESTDGILKIYQVI